MKRIILVLVILLLLPWGGPVAAENETVIEDFFDNLNLDTRDDGGTYTLHDQQGNVLMRTARHIHIDDRWIGADNMSWQVYEVVGDNAYARSSEQQTSWLSRVQQFFARPFTGSRAVQQDENVEQQIGIYHTHGAEAYVPSDGEESVDEGGGIIDVADSLGEGLQEQGVEIIKSDETHVPHDAGAYKRSRNTVEEMLADGVDAVIDVHRDAVAAEEYEDNGMVQIQLVVGRQNQNQAANQQFAEDLKAVADEKHPGLVKGIFSAQGNYNQDMSPSSTLIEVGTHETEKEQAQESVILFADVLASYLYGTAEAADPSAVDAETQGTAWTSILWILAAVIIGGGIFLYISAGSWPEMKRRLKDFTRGEFGDLFKKPINTRQDDED